MEYLKSMAVLAVGIASDMIRQIIGDAGTVDNTSPSEAVNSVDNPVNGPKVSPCGVAKVTFNGRDRFFAADGRQISKEEFQQALRDCGNSNNPGKR